jgi:hypothetical protein
MTLYFFTYTVVSELRVFVHVDVLRLTVACITWNRPNRTVLKIGS